MSERPDKSRRDFLERLKYVLGEERWLKFLEMAESGDLENHRQRFCELLEGVDWEQELKRFEFKRGFPAAFN
jgi:hypothetical protein